MRWAVLGAAALSFAHSAAAQSRPPHFMQVLSVKEFLEAPEGLRAVFVAGVLDGMSFTAYGMSWPDYPKWVECVRTKTVGDTANEIVAFLKDHPDFKEGVASALAQTLGKRCKKQ